MSMVTLMNETSRRWLYLFMKLKKKPITKIADCSIQDFSTEPNPSINNLMENQCCSFWDRWNWISRNVLNKIIFDIFWLMTGIRFQHEIEIMFLTAELSFTSKILSNETLIDGKRNELRLNIRLNSEKSQANNSIFWHFWLLRSPLQKTKLSIVPNRMHHPKKKLGSQLLIGKINRAVMEEHNFYNWRKPLLSFFWKFWIIKFPTYGTKIVCFWMECWSTFKKLLIEPSME